MAQTAPAGSGVLAPDLRGIERATEDLLNGASGSTGKLLQAPHSTGFAVDMLQEVEVNSRLLGREISDYWVPYLRRPVSASTVSAFKTWLFEALRREGYLGFVDVSERKGDTGNRH